MDNLINQYKKQAERIIQYLKEDLTSIRTGRVSSAIIENIIVDTYQGQAKLRLTELASITVSDAHTLQITPYDYSTTKDIEKAILKSPLGLNPLVTTNKIAIKLPPLTEEQRQKMIKVINQKIEDKKSLLRNDRDNSRKKIKNLMEEKEISEDDKYRLEKEIDKITQGYNEIIQSIKDKKEKELMEI